MMDDLGHFEYHTRWSYEKKKKWSSQGTSELAGAGMISRITELESRITNSTEVFFLLKHINTLFHRDFCSIQIYHILISHGNLEKLALKK